MCTLVSVVKCSFISYVQSLLPRDTLLRTYLVLFDCIIVYIGIVFVFFFLEAFLLPLILYLKETPFNTFANRANPYQAAHVRAVSSGSTLFSYGNIIRYDSTLVTQLFLCSMY